MKNAATLVLTGIVFFSGLFLFAGEKTVWKKGDPLPTLNIPMPWPKLEEAEVAAKIIIDNERFVYLYSVHNSTRNYFPIYYFSIDIRKNPQEHPFSSQDVTIAHSADEHAIKIVNGVRAEILEVFSPDNWHPVIKAKPKGTILQGAWSAGWAGGGWDMSSSLLLKPGRVAMGFSMLTRDPPSIREFLVDADLNPNFDNGLLKVPLEKLDFYLNSPDFNAEINKGVEFVGKTIAPVAPPEPFTISLWTARMETDSVEAKKIGWIKTDKNIAEIKKLISSLNTENKVKLKTMVKRIETYILAENKKGNLTDEADALIRLNALYLLRRMEQEGKTGK